MTSQAQSQQQRTAVHDHFTIERTLAVPPARVFHAFADREQRERWFVAPENWETGPRTLDFRVGGTETSEGRRPGGPLFTFASTYQDIVPDQRIVNTYIMHMDGTLISVSLTTVELEPTDAGGTRLTVTEQGVYLDGGDTHDARCGGVTHQVDTLVELLGAAA